MYELTKGLIKITLEFLGFIALVELWDTMNNFAYVLLFLCERKRGAHTEN